MCTVTYLPQGRDGFVLTSNRDEAPARSPRNLTLERRDGKTLVFPRDEAAGGTWLAVSSRNRLACLLNGAFGKHDRQPPYRMSRGLMVLEYFEYEDNDDFFRHFDFRRMEPFTMILCDRGRLHELKWDEQQTHIRELDPRGRYIWASARLFGEEAQTKREDWFADWLKRHPEPTREAILDFHRYTGDGDSWNDLVMNRDNLVRTVSISSILKSSGHIHFLYEDLLRDQRKEAKINLEGEVVGSH